MTRDNFDITFCNGEAHFLENGIEAALACPVKEKCYRFWTQTHAKESKRLGLRYHSFFMLTNPNDLTDKGCSHFWEKNK